MKPLRTRYPKIVKISTSLQRLYDLYSLPIDIYRLAKSLHIQVRKADLSLKYGIMQRSNSSRIIVVNILHSEVKRRFTVAHLLGHFLLHPDVLEQVEDKFHLFGVNTRFRPDENVREREANYFALSMLIPSSSLQEVIDIGNLDEFGDMDLSSIGKKFQVTANMMLARVMMERRLPQLRI